MVATVLNNKIDGFSPFFKRGKYFFMDLTAPITFNSKSFLKSSMLRVEIGFKLIEPGH